MKNDLSYHNLNVEDATRQTTLEVIASKWSYTLNWCRPNNNDAELIVVYRRYRSPVIDDDITQCF